MKITTMALAASVLAMPGVAAAQTQTQTQAGAQPQQQVAVTHDYQEIDDIRIIGADGKKIGEIEEAVIDQNGRVAYVVEFEEGFLGIDDREVVVPAERLTFDAGSRSFTTNLTEADMNTLQEWDD